MSRNKELIKKRNKAIVERYNQLDNIKTKSGKRVFTYAAISEKLAEEFYLTEDYAMRVVHNEMNRNDSEQAETS